MSFDHWSVIGQRIFFSVGALGLGNKTLIPLNSLFRLNNTSSNFLTPGLSCYCQYWLSVCNPKCESIFIICAKISITIS